MATYSPIDNTEVDPESPITSSLMIRLRDNPLAIQEGDASAPKIVTNALADFAVTAAKLASDTRQESGTLDNGSFLINGTLRINWVRFVDLGNESSTIATWQTPFLFRIYFAAAFMNFNDLTHQRRDNPVYILSHDQFQAEVYNANDGGNASGYVFAIGI